MSDLNCETHIEHPIDFYSGGSQISSVEALSHLVTMLRHSLGKNSGVSCHSFLQRFFQLRDKTWVSYIAGRVLYQIWATRLLDSRIPHIPLENIIHSLHPNFSLFAMALWVYNISEKKNEWLIYYLIQTVISIYIMLNLKLSVLLLEIFCCV